MGVRGTHPSRTLGDTHRGAFTPLNASPQQKRGEPPDPRDDVHALGILIYQFLVADLGAERPAGKWRKRLTDCTLQQEVLDLRERCWDDDPIERPGNNAAALADELRPWLQPSQTRQPTNPQEKPSPINPLGMEFVRLPTGSCWLGGGGGTCGDRVVSFADNFFLGLPVELVSSHDCQRFLLRLNETCRDTGWIYRLPTKAEGEYACRAAAQTPALCGFDFYLQRCRCPNFYTCRPTARINARALLCRTTPSCRR